MERKIKFFASFLFVFLIILIFKFLFNNQQVIGGDWPFFYTEQLKEFSLLPSLWNSNTGLGGPTVSPWIDSYLHFVIYFFVNKLGLPWGLVQKVFFFFTPILFSAFSVTILWRTLFKKISVIPAFIYIFNTYFFMLYAGGQMGVVLAYSLAPLVLANFIKVIKIYNFSNKIKDQKSIPIQSGSKIKISTIAGLVLALQVLFDPRVAYITIAAVVLYFGLKIIKNVFDKNLKVLNTSYLILYTFIFPFIITFLFNSFWLLPYIQERSAVSSVLGSAYSSSEIIKFFSFALFENSFSLLHPNWPENIFGKVYFMKPEFILLPILAYSSLFFISSKFNPSASLRARAQIRFNQIQSSKSQLKVQNLSNSNLTIQQFNNSTIIFFALLGLVGAFLAKGVNEPFGQVYLWLFNNFPGFNLFRDPTKFYLLVSISYSILIPFTVFSISNWINSKFRVQNSKLQFKIQNFLVIFFIFYYIFLIRFAVLGNLNGTFQRHSVPEEYVKLKNILVEDQQFYRTLWLPKVQRFVYYSDNHPALSAEEFFNTMSVSGILHQLNNPSIEKQLQDISVKYIVVPFDSEGEIFLNDRKYDEKKYESLVKKLNKVSWLRAVNTFKNIRVYAVENSRGKFFVAANNSSVNIKYKMISPVLYKVEIKNGKRGESIVFSERYNKNWVLKDNNSKISSQSYGALNSFILSSNGSYKADIIYEPQRWQEIGKILSIGVIILTLFILFF